MIWSIVALAIVAALSVLPTPYYLLAPGSAVDLSEHVAVRGHPSRPGRFYLTDVAVARASVLLLAGALVPGTRVVRRNDVVPAGANARSYQNVLDDAMDESQNAAAIVAERAAGYRVAVPPQRFVVAGFVAGSRARRQMRVGDDVLAVDGRRVRALEDVANEVESRVAGTPVRLRIERDRRARDVIVTTIASEGETRLGILLRAHAATARLPVPVRFDLHDISGSSGGLMFALAIYAALRGDEHDRAVAGTGTIATDGNVGRIEGTMQKVIAAERAGARVFLVPRENYAEVSHERGIRVIPVARFADATRALGL